MEKSIYVGNSELFFLLYSIVSKQSFLQVEDHVKDIERLKKCTLKDLPVYLIGTNKDRRDEREVSFMEGKQKAEQLGCLFAELSCKEHSDLELRHLFLNLVKYARDPEERPMWGLEEWSVQTHSLFSQEEKERVSAFFACVHHIHKEKKKSEKIPKPIMTKMVNYFLFF